MVLIEAGAHGLPTVATRHGGPVEIHAILKNGLLVEPTDPSAVGDALMTLLTDRHLWCAYWLAVLSGISDLTLQARREACRKSGLEHIHEFSWEAHCSRYFAVLDETMHNMPDLAGAPVELVKAPLAQRMLVVTMCSRDAPLAAKLLQRALASIASRALQLDTVAVVVASALSTKVKEALRIVPCFCTSCPVLNCLTCDALQDTLSIIDKAGVLQGSLHAVVADAGAHILTHTSKRQDLVLFEEWQRHISFRWLVR